MGQQIMQAITNGVTGYVKVVAGSISEGFNAAFIDSTGGESVLSNFGEFGLTMCGLGLGVLAVGWIVGKVF